MLLGTEHEPEQWVALVRACARLYVKAFISDHVLHTCLKKQPCVLCTGCSVLGPLPIWLLPAPAGQARCRQGLCSMD